MKRASRPKRRPRKQQTSLPQPLIERRFPFTRFVEFPHIKGRTVEKIEFYTTSHRHSITINFQDRTALIFTVEPCFRLGAEFADIKSGDQQTIQEWPPIHSKTGP